MVGAQHGAGEDTDGHEYAEQDKREGEKTNETDSPSHFNDTQRAVSLEVHDGIATDEATGNAESYAKRKQD
jgi:hypothetical protein